MKILTIRYLSHDPVMTGGARHEEYMINCLSQLLNERLIAHKLEKKIKRRIFRGLENLKLIFWGWLKAQADVNIVVGRVALSSMLRNCFTKKKTIIVFHNFDKRDGKGFLLNNYYKILFHFIKKSSGEKTAIVTVSPYFQKLFKRLFPQIPVFLIPNFFDVSLYNALPEKRDSKKILLGQYSGKNDKKIFELANNLSQKGYKCFFATLRPSEHAVYPDYEVKKMKFEEYLSEMATCYCSISFSGVNEGWPRMVHESLLVGTPVIGFDKGGLGDLLRESNSFIVKNTEEAIELIEGNYLNSFSVNTAFRERYDLTKAHHYLKPLQEFICS